jgi:hypothetical protein
MRYLSNCLAEFRRVARRLVRLKGKTPLFFCKSRPASTAEGSPVHTVITKINRMKTRQGESLLLKVDVGGETVRVFGGPEELAERLEASGYDIPANEIQPGLELNLPCRVVAGQGKNGYKAIEAFFPETASNGSTTMKAPSTTELNHT